MKTSKAVIWLSALVAGLALITSGAGLAYGDGGRPFLFTTARGDTVQMYGQGLYRYESLLNGTGFKGADVFILLFGVPLLLVATWLYRRGSLRGGLVLTGTLAFFLYNASHQALSYAYNDMFLAYVALFSASFFACVLAATSFDLPALPSHFSARLPRRTLAVFLFAVGAALTVVWVGLSILPALLQGAAPEGLVYATLVTHALDVGIIVPVALLAGVLLLRRAPLGYLLASIVVIISWTIGGGVIALSLAQILAGLLTGAQFAVYVAPFAALTLIGIGLSAALLGSCSESSVALEPHAAPAAGLPSAGGAR